MMSAASLPSQDKNSVQLNLGEDYSEIRELVRRICSAFPGRYWRDLDGKQDYPTAFVQALTEAGILSTLIPQEYGGSGLPLRAASVILEEIHASGGNAGACHAQMYMMGSVLRHGSAAQKLRYLPEIAAGKLRLQAFGVTEPTTGSDTTKLKTRAERRGDKYIVSGQKVWTSRALHSDLMLLLARTTPPDKVSKKSDGLSLFLVDIQSSLGRGLEIKPLEAMINHNTTEVFFDALEVPAENLIGEEGKGFRYILDSMNAERILIASEAIARAYAETEAAELLMRKAAALFDAGLPCGADANLAKLLASESAWHAAEATLQTFGGFGFAVEYDVERKWRETRLTQIAPISTNLILSYIGEHVLGMPRTY
jgi:acyl-CoA dehydrogenase